MRKILFVMPALYGGGAEKSLVNLLNLIDYKKYAVDLLLFKQEGLFLTQIPKEVRLLPLTSSLRYAYKFDMGMFGSLSGFKTGMLRLMSTVVCKVLYKEKAGQQRWMKCYKYCLPNLEGKYDIAVGFLEGEASYYVIDKVNAKRKILWVHSNFENIKEELAKIGVYKIDGVLADLGVSSHQLDEADRGFSYMQDAPLDMRMDVRCDFSAYDVVNTYSEEELAKIIKDYGEDNWAKRIAKFIVDERQEKPIETTGELVEVIKKAIPKKARIDGPHPAKRTFQAIRIEVNNELGVITKMIDDAVSIMNEGGRVCIITFHSLEDRIVKNEFRDLALDCVCPSHLPICQCDKESLVKVITRKPILPSKEEIEENPRSRSAKLRVAERI